VLVVGGGQIGTGKVETLLDSQAEIVVVDPHPSSRAIDLAAQGAIVLKRRRFRPTDLRGVVLVVAATGDTRTNRTIRRWSKVRGVVVNAVDDLPNCDVTVPAVIRRGPATIAITTGGATPAGARFLREELSAAIEQIAPESFGDLLDVAAHTRHRLRSSGAYRFDYNGWRQRLFEPLNRAIRSDADRSTLEEIAHRFEIEEEASFSGRRAGSVSLVGAGPGGADLITVRGAKALAQADVVVYDRLADPELLALAPVAAERIPVGKGKGFGISQQQITELLIEFARRGDHVVRLKGGDPFVFGRGGEEVDAVTAAGIAIDVIPGLSSALAGPALAGISLTDRRYASSFTVVTGHTVRKSGDEWASIASGDSTVVVLMASSTAGDVATELIAHGRAACEPVAFVHRAGRHDQQSAHRRLDEVAVAGCPFGSPTVMVVGEAAVPRAARAQVSMAPTRPNKERAIPGHDVRVNELAALSTS